MTADKSFKVCLVSISLAKGGLERSLALLSQMLAQKGHDVHLVILNDEVDYPYRGKLYNLRKDSAAKDGIFDRISRFIGFRKYLKQERFDVIIDHRPKNKFARELFYNEYLYRGFKTIYVVHSAKKEQYLTENPKAFSKICIRNFMNIAVSQYIETEVLNKIGILNTQTIHNAFDPSWQSQANACPDILRDKKYILTYGRLDDSIKDFTFLMSSFEHSELWISDYYLVIMGEGKDNEKLQQLAKSKICHSQIVFLPFRKNPFGVIKNALFTTLTSKYEGFPMVLVESLSLGTPVVALDIESGPNEIVVNNDNGLLVEKREVSLFADALKKMCLDTEFYAHCKLNAEASVAPFSMNLIAEKWHQLLIKTID